jgi:hypothetical protein
MSRTFAVPIASSHASRIDPTVSNTCPSGDCPNEDTSHVVRCPAPGRTSFYNDSVSELVEWLEEVDTDPQLTWMIEEFLYGRGDVKVAPLFADDLPMYGFLASLIDLWDSIILWRKEF